MLVGRLLCLYHILSVRELDIYPIAAMARTEWVIAINSCCVLDFEKRTTVELVEESDTGEIDQ